MPYKGLYYYYYGICLALFSTHSLLVVSHEPLISYLHLNCPLMATLLEFCRDIRCVKTGVTELLSTEKTMLSCFNTMHDCDKRQRETELIQRNLHWLL